MYYALLDLEIVTNRSENTTNANEKPGVSSFLEGSSSPMFRAIVNGALIPSELTALTQIV